MKDAFCDGSVVSVMRKGESDKETVSDVDSHASGGKENCTAPF